MNKDDKYEGHVIKLWSPFNVKIDENYKFLPRNKVGIFLSGLLLWFVVMIFNFYNRFLFGLKIEGKEKLKSIKGGAISICNHVHILDCTMVACLHYPRKVYFPTLQSNFEIPVIRHLIKALGGIPIPRSGVRPLNVFYKNVQKVAAEQIVQVYPEAVLYPFNDGIRTFEKGAFSFAFDANVPLLPLVLSFRPVTGWRKLIRKKPCIKLTVLDPVYPDANNKRTAEVKRLADECKNLMSKAFKEKTQY